MTLKISLHLFFFLAIPSFAAPNQYGLKAGDTAPNIHSIDIENKPFDLKKSLHAGPSVLVFYRGGWCPFCNLQLQSLQQKIAPALQTNNATMIAISVDLPKEGLLTKNKNNLSMIILSDPLAKILGDYHVKYQVPSELVKKYKNEYQLDLEKSSGQKHHIIAVPAVYVIDKSGKITYAFVNEDYKVRAPESEIISALEKVK